MRFLIPILFFVFVSCGSNQLYWEHEPQTTPVTEVTADPEIDLLVKPYKQGLVKQMGEVISSSSEDMIREKGESTLGNFVADLTFESGKRFLINEVEEIKDHFIFSYINFGGLRSSITKGEITVGDIFSLMPFDNEIVVLELKGEKVQELIDYNLAFGGHPSGNTEWKVEKSKGEFQINQMVVGNLPFEKGHNYFVITTDYLAGGGDKMDFFQQPVRTLKTGILLRDAILSSTKGKEDIFTPKDQRWYEVK